MNIKILSTGKFSCSYRTAILGEKQQFINGKQGLNIIN